MSDGPDLTPEGIAKRKAEQAGGWGCLFAVLFVAILVIGMFVWSAFGPKDPRSEIDDLSCDRLEEELREAASKGLGRSVDLYEAEINQRC
jgi:hypothetical protein